MKAYIVATNGSYTAITLAHSAEDAVQKVSMVYEEEYGEVRDDWEAYDLVNEYLEPDDVLEFEG